MNELISIVMTSYNYSEYISAAIESVINQTYTNWELIIVDDASSDNSVKIISEYAEKDKRIKCIVNKFNSGLIQAMQLGIDAASGNWIAFLESDDIYKPDAIEEKVKAISTGADLIFSDLEMIGFANEKYTEYFENRDTLVELNSSKFIKNFDSIIYKTNIIPTFSVTMVKKDLLKSCKFKPLYPCMLDVYLWSQLCDYKIYYINKKLTLWRIHEDSYINRYNANGIKTFFFELSIFNNTLKNKSNIIKFFKLCNYLRTKLIYLKITDSSIKINILNGTCVLKKKLKN